MQTDKKADNRIDAGFTSHLSRSEVKLLRYQWQNPAIY